MVNHYPGNFHSKTLSCRKMNQFSFRDVKWCFNASWGLKGLMVVYFLWPNITPAFGKCSSMLNAVCLFYYPPRSFIALLVDAYLYYILSINWWEWENLFGERSNHQRTLFVCFISLHLALLLCSLSTSLCISCIIRCEQPLQQTVHT